MHKRLYRIVHVLFIHLFFLFFYVTQRCGVESSGAFCSMYVNNKLIYLDRMLYSSCRAVLATDPPVTVLRNRLSVKNNLGTLSSRGFLIIAPLESL